MPVYISTKSGTLIYIGTPRALQAKKVAHIKIDVKESSDRSKAVEAAVQAERSRIEAIDAVADRFDPRMIMEAKYSEDPCAVDQFAIRAAEPKNRLSAARDQVKALLHSEKK